MGNPDQPDDTPKQGRQIHDVVFFGNDGCVDGVALAHRRLDDAFAILSGIQQPGYLESEHRKQLDADLIDIAADILMAIGVGAHEVTRARLKVVG